jgi:hypothetical protein
VVLRGAALADGLEALDTYYCAGSRAVDDPQDGGEEAAFPRKALAAAMRVYVDVSTAARDPVELGEVDGNGELKPDDPLLDCGVCAVTSERSLPCRRRHSLACPP